MRRHRCRIRGWRCLIVTCDAAWPHPRILFGQGTVAQLANLARDLFRIPTAFHVECAYCFAGSDEPTLLARWEVAQYVMNECRKEGIETSLYSLRRNWGVSSGSEGLLPTAARDANDVATDEASFVGGTGPRGTEADGVHEAIP